MLLLSIGLVSSEDSKNEEVSKSIGTTNKGDASNTQQAREAVEKDEELNETPSEYVGKRNESNTIETRETVENRNDSDEEQSEEEENEKGFERIKNKEC